MKILAFTAAIVTAGIHLVFSESAFAQGSIVRPTVSPYLNLLRNDFVDASFPIYQSFVRPQLEQQRVRFESNPGALQGRAVQQQLINRSRPRFALGRILTQPRTNVTTTTRSRLGRGNGTRVSTTGHPTAFSNLGSFYPGFVR